MEEKKFQPFLKRFAVQSGALLLAAALAVIIIDPFYHYHGPALNLKAVVTKAEYQCIGTLRHFDYDSIVLGSSVAENYNNAWFDEAFGASTVKGIKSSAATADLVYYLEEAFEARELKNVFYSLDLFALDRDPEQNFLDESMPLYLYNTNPFDDIEYLLNKDVLFEHIPYLFAMTYLDDYDEGSSYNWAQYKVFSKEETLSHYERPEEAQGQKPFQEYGGRIDANLDLIEAVVKKHPETQFYFMFPPYSMLWWDAAERKGETAQHFYTLQEAAERLLPYENAKLYFFQDDEERITDLDNYMDAVHFTAEINRDMVLQLTKETYRLTPENYETRIGNMKKLVDKIESVYLKDYFEQ